MAGRVWRVFAFNVGLARTNGLPPFPGMAFAAFRANASNATLALASLHILTLAFHFSSGALERERDFSPAPARTRGIDFNASAFYR